MHYNENAGRKQAVTQDGRLRYDIRYPKYKEGGYVVRGILEAATYGKDFCVSGLGQMKFC